MLQTQVLKDSRGIPMGVFIPMKDWENVKAQYPDIERFNPDIPQWEREFIDKHLETVTRNPERLQPIETLFQDL
jgi:hypothetical protein